MEKRDERVMELQRARICSGLTVGAVSKQIKMTRNTIEKWECGKSTPSEGVRFLYLYWLQQQGAPITLMDELPEEVRKKIPENHKLYVVLERNELGEIFVTAQAKRLVNGAIQDSIAKKCEIEKHPRLKQSIWIVYTDC